MTPTTTAAERADRGVQALAALMNYWLATSSHDKLAAILRWGSGESAGLDGGSLSRIRNGKQSRGAGLRHLDAMSEANRAIWLWHTAGPAAAIKEFGPHSSWEVKAEWIDEARWLPAPAPNEDQPLDLGDLAMLLMNRLELPYIIDVLLSPIKLQRASARLSELLDDLALEQGWGPSKAPQLLSAAYPSKDPQRQKRFRDLVTGTAGFTNSELEMEIGALAEMVRTIRKLDSYTPANLQAELLSARRRP